MENKFGMTAAASPGDRQQRRRWVDQQDENPQHAARLARFMNGVMLEDDEFMNIGLCGNVRHCPTDLRVFDEFGGMMNRKARFSD